MLSVVHCQHNELNDYAGLGDRLILGVLHRVIEHEAEYADFLVAGHIRSFLNNNKPIMATTRWCKS
jgi:hypothetical protein